MEREHSQRHPQDNSGKVTMENLINYHGSLPQRSIKIPPHPPFVKGGYEMPPFVKGGWGDFHKAGNDGFTLIELLIAMAVGLIVLGAMYGVFTMHNKTFSNQEQIAEMQQNARAGMDMMTREIRMAGYDPTGAGFDGITYNADQLQIEADINDDGNIINDDESYDPNEHIVYKYYDNDSEYPYQIKRKTGNGNFQPFAENIQDFTFVYLKADGVTEVTTSADNDNIRQIKITIIARTSKPDPDYTPNGGYRTYTLTSVITPRNLGL